MTNNTLKIKEFQVSNVTYGEKYKYTVETNELIIPSKLHAKMSDNFKSVSIDLIRPHHLDITVNSIMDFVPISTKVLGNIGNGVTHTLTGVALMITGADETGRQIHDFGSSNGTLSKQVMLGKSGTPDPDDFIINFSVIVKGDTLLSRPLITEVFTAADNFLQPIRNILKMVNGRLATASHEYTNTKHPGKPKVVVVKQVAGQGAMYDNKLFMDEPSGMHSGVSIIDINNFPVLLTPNEYRDGAIRAMV